MTGERISPMLPCGDLDEALEFYTALGFTVTYTQYRRNPYAVVQLDDIQIHLAAIPGFDPAGSYGSAIITVADPGARHEAFRTGLRERYGQVPVKGIPRLLPVRRKAGAATGFSVVDVGGNWLRFYRHEAAEEKPEDRRSGLARVIDVAARQGDARATGRGVRGAALPRRTQRAHWSRRSARSGSRERSARPASARRAGRACAGPRVRDGSRHGVSCLSPQLRAQSTYRRKASRTKAAPSAPP